MTQPSAETLRQRYAQFPENVRDSPGVYVGSVEEPSLIFREMFDNGVDLALDPKIGNDKVEAVVEDDFIFVKDNGPGMPLYTDTSVESDPIPACVGIFTRLHYGSKSGNDATAVQVGTHGMGAAACNALAESLFCVINIRRVVESGREVDPMFDTEDDLAILHFERGILISAWSTTFKKQPKIEGMPRFRDDFGTAVLVRPDPQIWESTKADINPIVPALIKSNLDSKKVKCKLVINGTEVEPLTLSKAFPKAKLREDFEFSFSGEVDGISYDITLGFAESWDHTGMGSVNGAPALQGPHLNSSINGISKAISTFHKSLTQADCKPGLRTFIQVSGVGRFRYDSQTKARLAEIKGLSTKKLTDDIADTFLESIKGKKAVGFIRRWVDTLFEYKKKSGSVELHDKIASEVQTSDANGNLRGEGTKVFEATGKNVEDKELFLVEGLSAAGGLVQARDKKKHAVLPLRGKIINTASADMKKSFDNKEVKTLLRILGCGVEGINFDIDALRYGKILISTDADSDGLNIAALLLALFARFAPKLIEEGRIYVLLTPLYVQGGKFLFDDTELDRSKPFARKKGLGSLDQDQIVPAMLNEDTRRLIQVTPDDIPGVLDLVGTGEAKKKLMRERGLID